jgi:hypothetical protein
LREATGTSTCRPCTASTSSSAPSNTKNYFAGAIPWYSVAFPLKSFSGNDAMVPEPMDGFFRDAASGDLPHFAVFEGWAYATLGLRQRLAGEGGPGTWLLSGAFGGAWVHDRASCDYQATVPCPAGSAMSFGPTVMFGVERPF